MQFYHLKITIISIFTIMLSACVSNTQTRSELVDTETVIESQEMQPQQSAWEEAYNQPLETAENAITEEPVQDEPEVTATINSITTQSDDIWRRIRIGLELSDYESLQPKTKKHLKWLLDRPDYVPRVTERAQPYLYYIVKEVARRDMPMEVALLPFVESGFNPYAYSRSHASGLWQFIPSTGRIYGLKQNEWYDGRRDVIEATRAALDYLQKLHNDFGDWQLAFAAYNCGEGAVSRAIRRNKAHGKPTDFWSLKLPRETSAYVPKLMAISHLVKFSQRYDINFSPVANEPYFNVVDLDSQIDLELAAEMAEVSSKEFYQLNPGFKLGMTPPDGPNRLLIPFKNNRQFAIALANTPIDKRIIWSRHIVKSGEVLGKIAYRYSSSVPAIKSANKLKNNTIRIGQVLLIPASKSKNPRLASNQSKSKPSVRKPRTAGTYTVRKGDTWWDIARLYDTHVTTLAEWNNKSPNAILKPGQKLVIKTSPNNKKSLSYTIQSGDSLWAISRKFNVSVTQVREWNGLGNKALLKPGQNLTLYLDES